MAKRYLLTGATGFVGANLARQLVARGEDVHVIARASSPMARLADLTGQLTRHTLDLLDAEGLTRLLRAVRPSDIWHQATYGGFVTQADARAIAQTNFLGTVNLLEAAMQTDFDCFINTGSSSEYGPKPHPMREDDLPVPLGAYGAAKAGATLYAQAMGLSRQLPIYTLRLFSPYGPYDDPTRLIPSVIAACLAGRAPQLATPGSVRDFLFIDDVFALYDRLSGRPAPAGSIFNAGSGQQATVGAIAEAIIRLTGADVEPAWGQTTPRPNEPARWEADPTRVREWLGWAPRYTLEQGLQATIDWHRIGGLMAGSRA